MTTMRRYRSISLVGIILAMGLMARPTCGQMKLYQTKYYDIYTDIDADEEKEAAVRMTKMAEEYHVRTRDFAGQIREKLPFYLYRSAEDFHREGGLVGSSGVFIAIGSGGKLMAVAGQKTQAQTWHTIQHEGFHQFAHAVIGGQMPIWLDEGLAEYFGESLFTGDGFVTGVIPPWRLARLKDEIAESQLKTFDQITRLSPQEWGDDLKLANYDQAWSMVHFFVHGEEQRYQSQLINYIRAISRGDSADAAWRQVAPDNQGLQERWRAWWTAAPANPTTTLYGRVAVATMTSFIARAYAQQQVFGDFDAFHQAVDNHALKINPQDWLPQSLIVEAFKLYGVAPHWELRSLPGRQPVLTLTLADDTRVSGTFVLGGGKVEQVNVVVDELGPALASARQLLDQGQNDAARSRVLNALHASPQSPLAAKARKFLEPTR